MDLCLFPRFVWLYLEAFEILRLLINNCQVTTLQFFTLLYRYYGINRFTNIKKASLLRFLTMYDALKFPTAKPRKAPTNVP